MIKSNNSYSKLKQVVVGRELEISKRTADFTFKHFYQSNLGESIYPDIEDNNLVEYKVDYDILQERIEDLDSLAKTLEDLGIKVHRPDRLTKVVPFTTPSFKSELSSASNVRDVTLVMGDKLIETPTYVRNRYFENISLYDVYDTVYQEGGQWIRCPHTNLTEDSIDLTYWKEHRDYTNVDKKYTMAIDGAQFLRLNDDVIVNVNSYNHYKGYRWVKSFYPDLNFHMVSLADNHIDGAIVALNETHFLVNPKYHNIWEHLPLKYQDLNKYFYLYPEDISRPDEPRDIKLASQAGMDINVLSVDENTVVVNIDAIEVIKILREYGFRVIPVQLRHSETFGGNIHCSTLDLERE